MCTSLLKVCLIKFWRQQGLQFKAWRNARIVFSMPPTLAASEHVFALLKDMFETDQLRALADYIETALMLRLQPALCRLVYL